MSHPYLSKVKVKVVQKVTREHPREASKKEKEMLLPNAVKVIIYTACLHSALYNLCEEMDTIGEYRHQKKKYLNNCIDKIGYVHHALYKNIGTNSPYFGDWYNKQLEVAEESIDEHLLIEPPLRAYNIVKALFRMLKKSNDACGRFCCPALVELMPEAIKLLERCEFPIEDKHIDFILENCIDVENLTKKFV